MLWEKQTNGIYVNICREDLEERIFEIANHLYGHQQPPNKSNGQSEKYRKTGNMHFGTGQWMFAIKLYNTSLCYAENGSEHISLAYGNRSACFLHLKMYEKCLADIDLAIKANYPNHLLPKLVKRRNDCMKQIEDNRLCTTSELQLSFEAHAMYPGMADVLQIQQNEQFGRHITVTEDIAVGKVLIKENAFVTMLGCKYKRCDACWKYNVNLIPCKKCTSALFCSGQCAENPCHKIQCRMHIVNDEQINDQQMQLVRSLLIGIAEFSDVLSLMKFVEESIASDPKEIPASLFNIKSKYRAFLKLAFDRKTMVKDTFATQICFVYKTLLGHPYIKEKFSTKKFRRFLMHLIGHHLCVVQCNVGALMYNEESPYHIAQVMTENLSILVNYINHSCAPNVLILSSNDINFCVTLRPIKTGDQLFVSYFRNDPIKHSPADRRMYLRDICEFDCDCERCAAKPSAPKELVNEFKLDPSYKYIRANGNQLNCCSRFGRNQNVLTLFCICKKPNPKTMMNHCVQLLDKYDQMTWTPELAFVVSCLINVLREQLEK